jgi:hypothetical protein
MPLFEFESAGILTTATIVHGVRIGIFPQIGN